MAAEYGFRRYEEYGWFIFRYSAGLLYTLGVQSYDEGGFKPSFITHTAIAKI